MQNNPQDRSQTSYNDILVEEIRSADGAASDPLNPHLANHYVPEHEGYLLPSAGVGLGHPNNSLAHPSDITRQHPDSLAYGNPFGPNLSAVAGVPLEPDEYFGIQQASLGSFDALLSGETDGVSDNVHSYPDEPLPAPIAPYAPTFGPSIQGHPFWHAPSSTAHLSAHTQIANDEQMPGIPNVLQNLSMGNYLGPDQLPLMVPTMDSHQMNPERGAIYRMHAGSSRSPITSSNRDTSVAPYASTQTTVRGGQQPSALWQFSEDLGGSSGPSTYAPAIPRAASHSREEQPTQEFWQANSPWSSAGSPSGTDLYSTPSNYTTTASNEPSPSASHLPDESSQTTVMGITYTDRLPNHYSPEQSLPTAEGDYGQSPVHGVTINPPDPLPPVHRVGKINKKTQKYREKVCKPGQPVAGISRDESGYATVPQMVARLNGATLPPWELDAFIFPEDEWHSDDDSQEVIRIKCRVTKKVVNGQWEELDSRCVRPLGSWESYRRHLDEQHFGRRRPRTVGRPGETRAQYFGGQVQLLGQLPLSDEQEGVANSQGEPSEVTDGSSRPSKRKRGESSTNDGDKGKNNGGKRR